MAGTRKTKSPAKARAGRAVSGPRDLELARLRRRVAALTVDYVAARRATPKLKASVVRLKQDIDAWRGRTGRRDFRAVATTRKKPNGIPGWTCDSCSWIMVSLGRICFLVGCDPEWNQCSYICIDLPKDNLPVS